jgi:hypothetical protein
MPRPCYPGGQSASAGAKSVAQTATGKIWPTASSGAGSTHQTCEEWLDTTHISWLGAQGLLILSRR